jgi:glycosyltransferase involved in cell wall biosynthesis
MQVDHVTFSSSGGAGLVASNLAKHQRNLGADARLTSVIKSSLYQEPFSHPLLTGAAIIDRYVVSKQPEKSLFSLYRNRFGLLKLDDLPQTSLLHLHWVNGVIGSTDLVKELETGRRVVWTLHDMAPFTGGCHHAHNCVGYQSKCEECPQSRTIFRQKIELAKKNEGPAKHYQNLALVAPTRWMERQVNLSSKFRNAKIVTIPNPISETFLEAKSKSAARAKLYIEKDTLVFILIAGNLSDPAKNVSATVDSIRALKGTTGEDPLLLLVGSEGQRFESKDLGIRWLGIVPPSELSGIAAAADWVVSSSLAESAGMTIAECAALGVPSIVIDSGGVSEMLLHGKSGLVAKNHDEFSRFIRDSLLEKFDREEMGMAAKDFAQTHFHPSTIAQKYLDLYESVF